MLLRARTVAWIAAVTVALTPAIAHAQKVVAPGSGAPQPATFLPLVEGSRWTWRVIETEAGGAPVESLQHAVVWGMVPASCKGELRPFTRLLTDSADVFLAIDRDDIERLLTKDQTDTYQLFFAQCSPMLKSPLAVRARWEWTADTAPDPEQSRLGSVRHAAKLLAVDEPLQTPVGTFRTAHVRVTATADGWAQPQVEETWFGRGVGIVQQTVVSERISRKRELVRWALGTPRPRDPIATLRASLHDGDQVEWLEAANAYLHLHGRFAVVRPAAADAPPRCVYVDDTVREFTPGDRAFWAERLQDVLLRPRLTDLGADPGNGVDQLGRPPDAALAMLTEAAAATEALRRRMPATEPARTESNRAKGPGGELVEEVATAKIGSLTVCMTRKLDELRAVAIIPKD